MAGKTKAILRRVKSVRSTRKITRAMEMVASAKLKTAQRTALALKPYADGLERLLASALGAGKDFEHPLAKTRPGTERVAVVLFTAERGLCGAYNTNVCQAALRHFREGAREVGGFVPVGAKGRVFLKRKELPVVLDPEVASGKPTYDQAEGLVRTLSELFLAGKVDRVDLVYTRFVSALDQKPAVQRLLPLVAPEAGRGGATVIWEPDRDAVLGRLIPDFLATSVYRAMLEAAASEFAARRMAMKNATDNASEMIDKLTLQYNQARQAAITQEIAEIVGGASALE